ncbi:cysteine hydrolase family protein [Anaeromyxobacter sp. SG17]|uniref:cysteine hydrolase family protein n=1 Tax=Anaeromyxobacter sp. SG17 TaxID=2925405 RepID=UPI001F5A1B05|nr:cysteine hydrolase family protein [Anaeromyxobacter sp. SG17]
MTRTALVVIDVQKGIFAGKQTSPRWPEILERIGALAARAAAAGLPVIYVQHDGGPGHRLEVGGEGWQLDPVLARTPPSAVCRKTACDAFFETPLQAELNRRGVKQLLVAGCMSQFCVDTTCRRAVSLGYDVVLVGDAHATADSGALVADQIIAHLNDTLDGFEAGSAAVTVRSAAGLPLEAWAGE